MYLNVIIDCGSNADFYSIHFQAVVLGHKIYAIGGRSNADFNIDSVECLDLHEPNPTWTVMGNKLNVGRSNFGACVVDKVSCQTLKS